MKPCGISLFVYELFIGESKSQVFWNIAWCIMQVGTEHCWYLVVVFFFFSIKNSFWESEESVKQCKAYSSGFKR